MKKSAFLAVILSLCAALSLSGCSARKSASAPSDAEVFARPFRMSVQYVRGEASGAFDFAAAGSQACSVVFTAPEGAAGMSDTLANGSVARQYADMNSVCELASLERAHPLRLLSSMLSSLESTGELPQGVSADYSSGVPTAIAFETPEVKMRVTSFEYSD